MTRYEYFEKWMTHEEWETWKRLSPPRFKQLHSLLNLRDARARRREYLMEEVSFATNRQAITDFENMTNMYLRWADTPQSHYHWSQLNSRTNPIR